MTGLYEVLEAIASGAFDDRLDEVRDAIGAELIRRYRCREGVLIERGDTVRVNAAHAPLRGAEGTVQAAGRHQVLVDLDGAQVIVRRGAVEVAA